MCAYVVREYMGKGHRNNMRLCVKERGELEDEAMEVLEAVRLFIVQSAAIWAPVIITSQQSVSVLKLYIRPW